MGKIFDTIPQELGYLLESIHNREVALPDFQPLSSGVGPR